MAFYKIQQTVSMLNELIESWTPKYQLAFLSSKNKRKYIKPVRNMLLPHTRNAPKYCGRQARPKSLYCAQL